MLDCERNVAAAKPAALMADVTLDCEVNVLLPDPADDSAAVSAPPPLAFTQAPQIATLPVAVRSIPIVSVCAALSAE